MRFLLPVRIWLWRARPALLTLGCALLLLAGVRMATAPPPAGDPVVVAARSLPAGTLLAAADLRVVRLTVLPAEAVADPATLVGRTVTVALPAGLPVVAGLVGEGRFTVDPPPGSVVLPVEVDAAALLRPGDRVDLLAPACTDEVVAQAALVVDPPDDRSVLLATSTAAARTMITLRDSCSIAAVVVE